MRYKWGRGGQRRKRKTKTENLTKFAVLKCPQCRLRANFTSYSVDRYFRHDADLKIKASKNAVVINPSLIWIQKII